MKSKLEENGCSENGCCGVRDGADENSKLKKGEKQVRAVL
jgi:hypothetical protein